MYLKLLHKIMVSCLCYALCACNTASDTKGASQASIENTKNSSSPSSEPQLGTNTFPGFAPGTAMFPEHQPGTSPFSEHQPRTDTFPGFAPRAEKLCYRLPERIDTFINAYDTVKPDAKIDVTFELKSSDTTMTSFRNIPVNLEDDERTEHQKLLGKFFSAAQYMTRLKNIGAYRLDFYDDKDRGKFCMRLRTDNTRPLNKIENEAQKLLYQSDKHQVFNKIINKKEPAEIYFETNNTLVFKNKRQAHGERALIIPKEQIYTLNHLKLTSEDTSIDTTTPPHELLAGEMILNARELAAEKYEDMYRNYGGILDNYKMFIKCHNCGLGYQSVYHIHLHLLHNRTPE